MIFHNNPGLGKSSSGAGAAGISRYTGKQILIAGRSAADIQTYAVFHGKIYAHNRLKLFLFSGIFDVLYKVTNRAMRQDNLCL